LPATKKKNGNARQGFSCPSVSGLPVGKQVEAVVLDNELGPCFYEHQLQNPRNGKWEIYEGCPKEFEHCPLCDGVAGGKDSYYVMMLTLMVLDPYINKNGVTVPHSRKLYAVKTNDQPYWQRQFDQNGSLRGRQYLFARDSQQGSNTGRPDFLAAHSEDAILASFGHPEIKSQDGKVIKQANADCYPFPYSQLFHRPSGEDLRRRYGGAAPIGSPAPTSRCWERAVELPRSSRQAVTRNRSNKPRTASTTTFRSKLHPGACNERRIVRLVLPSGCRIRRPDGA
jgi:hypothetical protein